MKIIFSLLLLTSFTAKASPIFNVKERLRIHLWTYGLEEKPMKARPVKERLPEEIERAIKKI